MMYCCKICDSVVGPGVAQVKHVVTRQVPNFITGGMRSEIAAEIPVCPDCKRDLECGQTVERLRKAYTALQSTEVRKPKEQIQGDLVKVGGAAVLQRPKPVVHLPELVEDDSDEDEPPVFFSARKK